jgi:ABC-type multidrug transport system fused ATPase/permease subunit
VTFQADTYDYYEYRQPYYLKENCIFVQVTSTTSNTGCTFSPARPVSGFNINGPYLLNYTCSILFLDMYQGVLGGCHNIAEMVQGVQSNFVPTLANAQYPDKDVSVLIVVPRPKNATGDPIVTGELAGPIITPYLSHSFGTSDGAPVLRTALLAFENAKAFSTMFASLRIGEVVATMEQQRGAWNDVVLSTGYVAYRWILFALMIILIIYSMYRLFLATVQGTVKLDQRTIVFVGGLVSAIMFAVGITLRRQTQLYVILDIISSFVFAVAFYLLLLLWTGILSKVQKMSQFSPLRVGIYLAMLIACFNLVYGLVWISVWPNKTISGIHNAMGYVLPASQLLVALLFLFYAIRFQMRKSSYNASKDTRRALTKLAWLAVLGFITFLIKAVTNFLGANADIASSVVGVVCIYVFQDVGSFARAAAILLVLGVRLPESRTTTSSTGAGSTSTGFSWGGWSKGWKRAIYGSQATSQTMSQSMSQGTTTTGMMSTTGYTDPKEKKNRFSKQTARLSSGSSSATANGVVTPTAGVTLHAPAAPTDSNTGTKWRPTSTASVINSSGGNKRWRK